MDDSLKNLLDVVSSRFSLDIDSLKILLVEISFSFIILKISLDKTSSSLYYLLDEVAPLDVESSENRWFTEIILSKEIFGVDFSSSSSNKLVDEDIKYSYRFELIPS